ncbi:threonine--tRNA ligase [Patescibacteria group bacterium]|nr:threonine--tRNA ligase [Patescibacteria group bacterium]MCL5091881.1 threonine--tRNA ligase [Patescibacteria group bacterium]
MNHSDLDRLRHSCAHLLAAAVMEIWPDTKRTIGPAIDNGFYFDFEFSRPITDADLEKIEQKMRQLAKGWREFKKYTLSAAEAKKQCPDNPYKHELIDAVAKKNTPITFYKSGDYWDLCEGGHVDHPDKQLIHFKLLSIAGAYWRGSEKNPMLTRIYGTIFPTKAELDRYLTQLEEAKKRDHRKIGKDLDLFVFSDLVGKGLPMLTGKGATIRRVLERFVVDEELKRGYEHVVTPPLAKVDLYRTSGHYPYYKETMYPTMQIDEEELILRPMTCPHHFMLYKAHPHSYRELPVRYAEISPQFRYEKSGELSGLIRVRMFMLADAHIVCTKDQVKEEIVKVLELIDFVNRALGLKKGVDYRYRLSLGDRHDQHKYYKDDRAWDEAESVLRRVLQDTKADFYEAKNEAAFYGPKIDVQMKNVNGKEETAFTVQYDFVMPKRFQMRFTNASGQEEEPVVIHRASLGCFERTMAFLLEHYAGALPLWLSPIQVAVLPISDQQRQYATRIDHALKLAGIRSQLNQENETIGKKIRAATLQKIPYMIIIGNREQQETDQQSNDPKKMIITARTREGKDMGKTSLYQFINLLQKQIEKYL